MSASHTIVSVRCDIGKRDRACACASCTVHFSPPRICDWSQQRHDNASSASGHGLITKGLPVWEAGGSSDQNPHCASCALFPQDADQPPDDSRLSISVELCTNDSDIHLRCFPHNVADRSPSHLFDFVEKDYFWPGHCNASFASASSTRKQHVVQWAPHLCTASLNPPSDNTLFLAMSGELGCLAEEALMCDKQPFRFRTHRPQPGD